MFSTRNFQKFRGDLHVIPGVLDDLNAAFACVVFGPGVAGQTIALFARVACVWIEYI